MRLLLKPAGASLSAWRRSVGQCAAVAAVHAPESSAFTTSTLQAQVQPATSVTPAPAPPLAASIISLAAVQYQQQATKATAAAAATAATAAVPPAMSPAASSLQPPAAAPGATATQLRFDDYQSVFAGQSTWQLLRAYGVLRLCGVQPFVRNAEPLLKLSSRVLGQRATLAVVKSSFFGHFCAGETMQEVERTMGALRARGVGSILDYAAEDDVSGGTAAAPTSSASGVSSSHSRPPAAAVQASQQQGQAGVDAGAAASMPPAAALGVVGRTYDYASEAQCDRHVEHFLSAVDAAARQPGRPAFAAIKMTALGNPQLLRRASTAIATLHSLFSQFDEDGSGTISGEEFQRQWTQLVGGLEDDPRVTEEARRTFAWLGKNTGGKVDYVAWCQRLDLPVMPLLAERITSRQAELEQQRALHPGGAGSAGGADNGNGRAVAEACLDAGEVALMGAMMNRLQVIVREALRRGVKLMIDAEHSYFQQAIEHCTLQLMREHNHQEAWIYNTYQAYLVDCRGRLLRDVEMARREGWRLGAKLVRGAYLHLERHRAEQLGLPSPCWPSLEETHASYAACMADLMQAVADGRAEVLYGTHNQGSVEGAVRIMDALGLMRDTAPVYFGQLLGMSDHLTLALGGAGYRAFKYVPYGRVDQVMPYLLRRASENQDILKGAKMDLIMLRSELRRRASSVLAPRGAGAGHPAA